MNVQNQYYGPHIFTWTLFCILAAQGVLLMIHNVWKLSLSAWLTSFQKFELRSFTHLGSSCLVPGFSVWISRSFLPQFQIRTFDALIFYIKPSWWSLIHSRIDEYYYRYTCKSRLSSDKFMRLLTLQQANDGRALYPTKTTNYKDIVKSALWVQGTYMSMYDHMHLSYRHAQWRVS